MIKNRAAAAPVAFYDSKQLAAECNVTLRELQYWTESRLLIIVELAAAERAMSAGGGVQ